MKTKNIKPHNNTYLFYLIENLKSKDKKIRYQVLNDIMKLSRSKKRIQKAELLKILNETSYSSNWEERYISMYALSRYMWRSGSFEEVKTAYNNVLRLLEDSDGRVRMAAKNALEHFSRWFTTYVFCGGYIHFNEKEVINLWMNSLFMLWEKTKQMDKGKRQEHMMRCVEILFRTDMDELLTPTQLKKYDEIWNKIQELDNEYNELLANS